ncbi:MAG: HlyD family efflux transporter periplasmic adaptor subunit [candidate division Zixibacteria bacterium]|nr:HlyD family efflux transporter periplasmic adaptor subunit [candidate division Zixibacteria bacterium]
MKTEMKEIQYILLLPLLLLIACSNSGNQEKIEASGTIEAQQSYVSSKISAEVRDILVEEGDLVEKGDTLVVLDCSKYDIQLKQAKAGASQAEAQLKILLNGARIEDLELAEEKLAQAEANWMLAKKDYERIEKLRKSGSATAKQLDDAETRLDVALAQYNSAKAALQKLKNWSRPEEIEAGKASLTQAEAAEELASEVVSDCYITAPISGIVTQKTIEIGELATPGAYLSVISNQEKLELMIYVTEPELGYVKIGQKARVSVDSYPDESFNGEVVFISPEAEFTPKNIQTKEDRVKLVYGVKLIIENPDRALKPGMPADAVIETN